MPPAPVVSPVAYVVLLISCANLVFVVIAFFSDGNSADIVPSVPKMASSQTLALGLLFVSQLLFLALNIIGLFQWHRFTVGDPVTVVAALCGASLSVGSLAVGPWGPDSPAL